MDPDRDLVAGCQKENPSENRRAFEELYSRYRDRVYNIAYRITGNSVDALDASQETFGLVFRKIRDFRHHSRFSSWLYRVAVNASIDLKRRGIGRRPPIGEGGAEAPTLDRIEVADERTATPDQEAGGRELEVEIQRAIDALSPKLRAIVVLRHLEGLSYEQIREVLRCSMGTVKSRLARAHEALEGHLSKVIERHYVR